MAKSRKLEETLAVLNQLRDDPTSDTAEDVLWQRVCQTAEKRGDSSVLKAIDGQG